MASLAVALNSASSGMGSPCKSPGKMNATFRGRTTNDPMDLDRRTTLPVARRHVSGFHPSSARSSLTLEIEIARARRLMLTPLEPVLSPVEAHAHFDPISDTWGSSSGRGRARTMPERVLRQSYVEDANDADEEDSSDEAKTESGDDDDEINSLSYISAPDTDAIFGHLRTVDHFASPHGQLSGSEDDIDGHTLALSTRQESNVDEIIRTNFAVRTTSFQMRCSSPIESSESDDITDGELPTSGPVDITRARRSFGSYHQPSIDLRQDAQDTRRRDSRRPNLYASMPRKWVNGTNYYMAEDHMGALAKMRSPAPAVRIPPPRSTTTVQRSRPAWTVGDGE